MDNLRRDLTQEALGQFGARTQGLRARDPDQPSRVQPPRNTGHHQHALPVLHDLFPRPEVQRPAERPNVRGSTDDNHAVYVVDRHAPCGQANERSAHNELPTVGPEPNTA